MQWYVLTPTLWFKNLPVRSRVQCFREGAFNNVKRVRFRPDSSFLATISGGQVTGGFNARQQSSPNAEQTTHR